MTKQEKGLTEGLSQEPTTFGEFVDLRCRELGLTRSQLARECDVEQPYISKITTDRIKDPSGYKLLKILRALGVKSFAEVERFFEDPENKKLDEALKTHFASLPTPFAEVLSQIRLTIFQKKQLVELLEPPTVQ